MHIAKKVAFVLVIIGGLAWGIYGVSGYNVVEIVFGNLPMIENIVYVLVGLSALFMLFKRHKSCWCSCKTCDAGDHCGDCCDTDDKSKVCPVGTSGEARKI